MTHGCWKPNPSKHDPHCQRLLLSFAELGFHWYPQRPQGRSRSATGRRGGCEEHQQARRLNGINPDQSVFCTWKNTMCFYDLPFQVGFRSWDSLASSSTFAAYFGPFLHSGRIDLVPYIACLLTFINIAFRGKSEAYAMNQKPGISENPYPSQPSLVALTWGSWTSRFLRMKCWVTMAIWRVTSD